MSIPLRPPAFRLPDFRNQGVWLRVLLATNGLMLLLALVGNRVPARLAGEVAEMAALVEPALLLVLAVLYLLARRLQGLAMLPGAMVVVALAMLITAAVDALLAGLTGAQGGGRAVLAAGGIATLLLYWLNLRARAQSPALAEARLLALTARIRPHFLYNSLNAVLGVLRDDPRRAEAVLEALADLFRALMRDNRDLTPLSEEIALARKYLDIERLRLGERLQVRWEVADCPPDALAPPLLLQPLLENAVYHGIEPVATPGEVSVRILAVGGVLRIEIENPAVEEGTHRTGNRMAIDNLRERLALFYDLEARLDSSVVNGRYRVRVDLPGRPS